MCPAPERSEWCGPFDLGNLTPLFFFTMSSSDVEIKSSVLTGSPCVDSLMQKIDLVQQENPVEVRNLVLEWATQGSRSKVFLCLYLPSECIAMYGGVHGIVQLPMPADELIGTHGMRLNIVEVDLDAEVLLTEQMQPLDHNEADFLRKELAKIGG